VSTDCPFCLLAEEEVVRRDGPCFAMWTGGNPIGSAMVLPIAHRAAPWDLTSEEWSATQRLLTALMQDIEIAHHPDGWNVGWNVMPTGGQSIPHAHCHLVPRYADEPYAGRGIRWWVKRQGNRRPPS